MSGIPDASLCGAPAFRVVVRANLNILVSSTSSCLILIYPFPMRPAHDMNELVSALPYVQLLHVRTDRVRQCIVLMALPANANANASF